MATIIYNTLYSAEDEIINAEPKWTSTVYSKLACNGCNRLADDNTSAINVPVMSVPHSVYAIVGYPVGLDVLRLDLFEILKKHLSEFVVSNVLYNNTVVATHRIVRATASARLLEYGDPRTAHTICKSCGRIGDRTILDKPYYRKEDVLDREIFTSADGLGLYLSQRLTNIVSVALVGNVLFKPVAVV